MSRLALFAALALLAACNRDDTTDKPREKAGYASVEHSVAVITAANAAASEPVPGTDQE